MQEGISEIAKRFKSYNKSMMDIWKDYSFMEFYLPEIHDGVKNNSLPVFRFPHLYNNRTSPTKKTNIYGVVDHLTKSVIPVRALIESVSTTEHFLQEVTFRVYRDYQYKLEVPFENPEQTSKLLHTILSSVDKDEIVYKIAEEKIRGIFYGNPVDFFKKDKAKLGFDTYFKDNYNTALKNYAEIIARRNIYTHNQGKVDRKYKREVKDTSLRLGQIALIDRDYIKETIILLRGFSVIVTKLVLENTYGVENSNNGIRRKFETFESLFKGI